MDYNRRCCSAAALLSKWDSISPANEQYLQGDAANGATALNVCLAALGSALLALCALFARLTLVGALICP